ncbi:hypothetical protein [Pseudoalteromonas phage J2-1_QLiu-2017]|nr:hypothetical protein [Pseudoalteromonas phage J2-1_QLiu-2017]
MSQHTFEANGHVTIALQKVFAYLCMQDSRATDEGFKVVCDGGELILTKRNAILFVTRNQLDFVGSVVISLIAQGKMDAAIEATRKIQIDVVNNELEGDELLEALQVIQDSFGAVKGLCKQMTQTTYGEDLPDQNHLLFELYNDEYQELFSREEIFDAVTLSNKVALIHKDQKYAGARYTKHLALVLNKTRLVGKALLEAGHITKEDLVKMVFTAIAHDAIEDGATNPLLADVIHTLEKHGAASMVSVLTKADNQEYIEYIDSISKFNDLPTIAVKQCDVGTNLEQTTVEFSEAANRLNSEGPSEAGITAFMNAEKRMVKYLTATDMVTSGLSIEVSNTLFDALMPQTDAFSAAAPDTKKMQEIIDNSLKSR